jgi:hypothetical protein
MQLIVHFPTYRMVEKIIVRVGGEATLVEVKAWSPEEGEPVSLSMQVAAAPDPRFMELALPKLMKVEWIDVHVKNLNNEEPAHVHLWELQFYP